MDPPLMVTLLMATPPTRPVAGTLLFPVMARALTARIQSLSPRLTQVATAHTILSMIRQLLSSPDFCVSTTSTPLTLKKTSRWV